MHSISSLPQGQHETMYTFQSFLTSIFLVHLVVGQTSYANFHLNSVPVEGIQWLGITLTVAGGNKQLPSWAVPPLLHPCLCPSHPVPPASHSPITAPADATVLILPLIVPTSPWRRVCLVWGNCPKPERYCPARREMEGDTSVCRPEVKKCFTVF